MPFLCINTSGTKMHMYGLCFNFKTNFANFEVDILLHKRLKITFSSARFGFPWPVGGILPLCPV